jgi:hypothetical protein
MSGFQKYKDDQLLRNPGGRDYCLDEKRVVEHSSRQSVWGLIGKDFSDSFGNIRNFFGNLFLGSPFLYRDERNDVKEDCYGLWQTFVRTSGAP